MSEWGDKAAEWGWSVVLVVLGGVATIVKRWISMLAKHEAQLAVLEANVARSEVGRQQVLDSLADHRRESAKGLEDFRAEVRADIRQLIDLIQK